MSLCFSISSSAFDATVHKHITATPMNAPINKPIIKPIILISPIYNYILLRQATAMQSTAAACCLISIVLQGGLHTQHRCRHIGLNICKTSNVSLLRHWDFSEYETALLWLVFILNIPQQGTHQTVMHLTSLEFHHRGDLPQPPSLVATVLSRSTFDLTEVSLSPLPVIAFIEFAFQCLSPEDK